MDITVEKYREEDASKWDRFVRNESRNGGIFHERAFLSYHGDRFEDCSILVRSKKNDRVIAVIPAAVVRGEGGIGIVSHPGSTYGGVIFSDDIKTRVLKKAIHAAIKYYHEEYDADYFQLTLQEEFHTGRSFGEVPFLLWHRGFELKSKEASSVKYLQVEDFYSILSQTTRNLVNRFKRCNPDVEIDLDTTDIEGSYRVIDENLRERYTKSPTHTLNDLLTLKSSLGERIRCFTALKDGRALATVLTFDLDDKVVHDFYIAQSYGSSDDTVLRYLFLRIFEYLRDKGFLFFNFGISSRDRWIKWGILEFKEKFSVNLQTRDTWILGDLGGEWPGDGEPTT